MQPDLSQDIFDALKLGYGAAGSTLEAAELFVVADAYAAGDVDHPPLKPVILHPSTGRRYTVELVEVGSVEPYVEPEPELDPDIAIPTNLPHEAPVEAPPEVGAQEPLEPPIPPPPTPEEAADGALHPQPDPPAEPEQQIERPEPIQSFSHEPQPEEPPSNVPEDFEFKVEQINEQLQPGAPLPEPAPVTPEEGE